MCAWATSLRPLARHAPSARRCKPCKILHNACIRVIAGSCLGVSGKLPTAPGVFTHVVFQSSATSPFLACLSICSGSAALLDVPLATSLRPLTYQANSVMHESLLSQSTLCSAKCSGSAVLLDVRLGNKYEASHAACSLSTPLYNPIQKWDLPSTLRRAGFAFFGIYGTGRFQGTQA